MDDVMGKATQPSSSFYSVHPHVVTARLVFAYWICGGKDDKDKHGSFKRFRLRWDCYYRDDLLASSYRHKLVEVVLRAGCYDYRDYGAQEADRARHTLADVAYLWTEKYDSGAKRRYEVAAAAGNALAGEIVNRFASGASTSKLARKYQLEGFATCHLENLPTGLARLEAAIEDQDGETRARREEKEKKRAERAVLAAVARRADACGESLF